VIVFPNGKINIGLRVVQKRKDGFHDIETIFYPVPVKDALEIVHNTNHEAQLEPSLHIYGLQVGGIAADNLCLKAWQLLKKDFPHLPAVDIQLLKMIPIGGGLGGGSADGAFMLQLLNEKFHLELSAESLIQYALQLGSDCPFFIFNKPCVATGRGELLEPLSLSLQGFQLVLIFPGIHVNTGWAFSQLQLPEQTDRERMPLSALITQPVADWKLSVQNDFEAPVFSAHPELKAYRDLLYQQGALYAAMSGSGSTVYGLFEKNSALSLNIPAAFRLINLP